MSRNKKTSKSLYFAILVLVLAGALIWFFYPKKSVAPAPKPTIDQSVIDRANQATTPNTQPQTPDLSWPAGQTIDAKILMYHHIGPLPADADAIRQGLTVSAENFDTQMKYLKDGGYNVVTMADLFRQVAQESVKPKTAVLTFDDGYADNFSVALPVLQKYNLFGTFFIISGKIGQADYMTSAQIKSLSSAGNEIGSHTVNHLDLATLKTANLDKELADSKTALEDLIDQKVISLCYPSGKFNAAVENEANVIGYKTAVTTEKGAPFSSSKPFEIPRYRINPTTSLSSLLGK